MIDDHGNIVGSKEQHQDHLEEFLKTSEKMILSNPSNLIFPRVAKLAQDRVQSWRRLGWL